jgi:thiol-disulfide isomerase/thioredoxin
LKKLDTILIFFSLYLSVFCSAQEVHFTINGYLKHQSLSKKVFFPGQTIEEVPLDSNNHFTYTGVFKESGGLSFHTENSWEWIEIWVGEGQINVTLEEYAGIDSNGKKLLKVISISGPEESEKNQWFRDYRNELNVKYNGLPLSIRKDSIAKQLHPFLESYVSAHPDSKFSAHLIDEYAATLDSKSILLALLTRKENAEEAIRIERYIRRERLLKKGNALANFQQQQLNGKLFSLNSLSGQYVLLEFWASDCPPCRAANPELIKIYSNYHDKGFEIVGVSLDESRKAWLQAVKRDKLPWIQVSDLKGWDNAVSFKYSVNSIPFNILLDKDQKVIATNLNPSALGSKLDILLGKTKATANTALVK